MATIDVTPPKVGSQGTPKETPKPDQANPDDVAAEEALASALVMGDLLPTLWWLIYKGCQDKGFTKGEAKEWLRIYIAASTPMQSKSHACLMGGLDTGGTDDGQ